MADRFSRRPASRDPAACEARRATAEILARIAADRRRSRRWARFRSRDRLVDLGVAMATYAGLTLAMLLGTIYGLRAALHLLIR